MKTMRTLAKVSCLLVGVLFIFSGLIKAVDPLGFSYKLEEYFLVFHIDFLNFSSVFMAYSLCALEVIIGLALIFRYKIDYWSWWLMSLIIFFTIRLSVHTQSLKIPTTVGTTQHLTK